MTDLVTLADVRDADRRIRGVLRATPLSRIEAIDALCGGSLFLKEEQRQRTGSFKIRGAFNRVSRLPRGSSVVAASAGNHAQGVALAARLRGLPATIFMPDASSLPKVRSTRDYGADVRYAGDTVDDAVIAALAFADETGAVYVPPFDDRLVIAGQGTLALELASDAAEATTVVVPVGGGGLIAGIAAAYAELAPHVRVVGVEAEGAAALRESLAAGEVRTLRSVATIADGIAVKSPSELTLAHAQRFVDEVVTVTDEEIGDALVALLERAKAVVEPSGAAALAAVLSGRVPVGPEPIVVLLSGGNVDPLLLSRLIEHGLTVGGRYMRLRIDMRDRPGSLATVTRILADLGLNVLDVEHHREGVAKRDVDQVELAVTVETRGPAHREECLRALRDLGLSFVVL
jgi:threonine dehydratase